MQRSLFLLVGAFASMSLGCQKDADIGESETDESGRETETASDESDTDTETETETDEGRSFVPDDETETETGDPPPEPKTCREMLDCVFMCLGDLGLECLQMCGEGFDPEEAQKAGELVLCLGEQCVEKEQCVEFTSEECIGCIGLGLFLPEPPGCEEPALACE